MSKFKHLKECGKNLSEDDITELAMAIENKILDEVCIEDNKNMQFIIPYDKNCRQAGLDEDGNFRNPPNSWDLHDTIAEYLFKKFGVKNSMEEDQ